MRVTEKLNTIVTKELDARVMCDCCGKILDDIDHPDTDLYKKRDRMWYTVTRHHNDWGHESVDSWKYSDYCQDCIKKAFDEYLEDESDTKQFEVKCQFPYIQPRINENMKGDI